MTNALFLVESGFFFLFLFVRPILSLFSWHRLKGQNSSSTSVAGFVSDFMKHLQIYHASASPCKHCLEISLAEKCEEKNEDTGSVESWQGCISGNFTLNHY